MSSTTYQEQINSLTELIKLINPHAGEAEKQTIDFVTEVHKCNESDMSEFTLMMIFKEVTQWKSSFYVDWKDTSSLVASLNKIAELWQVHIQWGIDDPMDKTFLNNTDVHTLLDQIYEPLNEQGLRLWGYDTSGEDYAGWLARIENDDEISSISKKVGIDFFIECTGASVSRFDEAEIDRTNVSNHLNKNLLKWEIIKPMLQAFPKAMQTGGFKARISLLGGLGVLLLICAILIPIMVFLKFILYILEALQIKSSDS